MHPLFYKQWRSFVNALRRSLRSARAALGLLIAALYGALTLGFVVAGLVLPTPPWLARAARGVAGGEPAAALPALRGALTLTLLLLATTAIFQNPLLRLAPADIDVLFATPISPQRVLLGRVLQNHLRALLAGYFFWGLTLAPVLRLAGYHPWPLGAWALLGLTCLFAALDQGFAALQAAFSGAGGADDGRGRLWLGRAALGLLLVGLALPLLGLAARVVGGSWAPLRALLDLLGGGWLGYTLLPLGLAGDLLFLPTLPPAALRSGGLGAAAPPLLGLALLDLLTAWALLRRTDGLLEAALSPGGSGGFAAVLRASWRPSRLLGALWRGERAPLERAPAAVRAFGSGAGAHAWRRLIEMRRAPVRNLLAVVALGAAPLAIYGVGRRYSLFPLLTAIIFSASLGTQLFADTADHLRYADDELAAPVRRGRLLAAALLPRVALYWLGGLLLLAGVGLTSRGARWDELALLALWYPLVLLPLLALRGALVLFYPAAGVPGQRDPVQAVLVTLLNGLLTLGVILLALLPFGVLLALVRLVGVGRSWFWPVVFASSGALAAASWALLVWAYRRFEPAESV